MEAMDQRSTKTRQCYAVQTGDYVGQMFMVCEVTDEVVGCLSVPAMENIKVPKDKWIIGRNSDIIDFVEVLPRKTFKVIEAQYKHNEDSNN